MERNISEIISQLGRDYNLDQREINRISTILQKEFYIKLKHIRNLSLDTWKSLNLPINLYYEIKDMYESASKTSQPILRTTNSNVNRISSSSSYQRQPYQQKNNYYHNYPQDEVVSEPPKNPNYTNNSNNRTYYRANNNSTSNNYNNYNNPNNNNNRINPPRQSQKQNQISPNEISSLLSSIYNQVKNLPTIQKVFKQIHMIISNIYHNPGDQKFRRFNINKLLNAYNYPSIKNFFTSIGFKQMNEYMYLTGDANQLITPVMTELNSFIKRNRIAESHFDPYRGAVSSLTGSDYKLQQMKKSLGQNISNFEDMYEAEINRRNKIILQTRVQRCPKYFMLKNSFSLGRLQEQMNDGDNTSFISNTEDDRMIYQNAMNIIKMKQNDRFTLKSRTKFEQLMKTPIYIKADIRLKFPDECIIQGSFALYENIGKIYEFIREYLNNRGDKFNISTTPPLKRYLKLGRTIQEEKLFPNILMYVNFDGRYNGLDKNKTSRIISPMD